MIATSPQLRLSEWLMTLALAVGLTMLFFWPLWNGGGVIGGDTLTYFYPQKQFLAEQLQAGHIPLWNNRSGFGYPLVAESQTGVFYPPNLLLYRFLNLETAYIAGQLSHYVLGFVFTWLYARRVGLHPMGAWLAALVYIYGWFPPRQCLEWAIVGGCYLPGVLWFVEGWLQSSRARPLVGAAVCMALQMLSGHFHLAFMTQLVVVSYSLLRLWWARDGVHAALLQSRKSALVPFLTVALGLGLASAQLLPTWELKQQSQRQASESVDFDPAYGSIPPLYLTQVAASWFYWYSSEINRDMALGGMTKIAATNQVEAHLYFGLIPLGLVVLMLSWPRLRSISLDRFALLWLGLGIVAVIYATGYLVPVARYIPGFGFFRGPGRYGLITTLAVAFLAARGFQALNDNQRTRPHAIIGAIIMALTTYDLWLIPQTVNYVSMVSFRPTNNLQHSAVRELLRRGPQPARLYAPGPNLTNMLGSASVPEYLGLGPGEYYSPETKAPALTKLTPEFLDWAEQSGITHVLTFEPVSQLDGTDRWKLIWADADRFLNQAWGRSILSPIYLYELTTTRGRIWTTSPNARVVSTSLSDPISSANEVRIKVDADDATTVVLTDLLYPGWNVSVDGQPATATRFAKQFRAVDVLAGQHEIVWRYQPSSVRIGFLISGISTVIAFVVFFRRSPVPRSVP